jgi:hypothetical protein
MSDKLEMTHKEATVAHFKITLVHMIEGGGKLKETVEVHSFEPRTYRMSSDC